MTTVITTPEFSLARVAKPPADFESKYEGLGTEANPIAIPGTLDQFAGDEGYDPNLLAGIPVPMGARIFVWLPKFIPSVYGGSALNYRFRLIWRLRSLGEQIADPKNQRESHFGRLLPGVNQVPATVGPPVYTEAPINQGGPRFVVPTAFETVQIINNKFIVTDIDPGAGETFAAVQKGTTDASGDAISPGLQEPAEIAVVSARTNTYNSANYSAPLSTENFPGPGAGSGVPAKMGAAGLLSQGYYPDQAGIDSNNDANAAYPAGGMYLPYETVCKGDELLLLLDRDPSLNSAANPTWDFEGVDRNVSRIFGTDAGTRNPLPTFGIYILTGSSA